MTTSTSYYERDPGGTLMAPQTGIGTTTTETYYYFDGNGSVLGLLDPSGKQAATYTYDPYGGHPSVGNGEASDSTQANANPWRYARGQADATTGLTKFGVRYYDPSCGRWTQLDPLTHLLDLREGNRYAYAGSDPINSADPSGKCIHSGYTDPSTGNYNPYTCTDQFPSTGTASAADDALFVKLAIAGGLGLACYFGAAALTVDTGGVGAASAGSCSSAGALVPVPGG